MRITAVMPGKPGHPRAIHIYRVTSPLNTIGKKTRHEVAWIHAQSMATGLTAEQRDRLLSSDIIVMARPVSSNADQVFEFCALLRSKGAKLVYETDDDLTELYRDISKGTKKTSNMFVFLADAVTVTTQPLADLMGAFTDRPIYVLPNYIEHSFFSKRAAAHKRKYSGTLNIMLTGTPTHGEDWIPASNAAYTILEEYPEVRLLIGGFHPNYIKESEQVKLIPHMPYYAYPTMIAEADIVIAAIDPDDRFNDCKSAVKALESWAAKRTLLNGSAGGAAVIATDSKAYAKTVKHRSNGLLVEHTDEGYYGAIKSLIDDERLRTSIQRRGWLDVTQKHSINTGYRKWLSAYTTIMRS